MFGETSICALESKIVLRNSVLSGKWNNAKDAFVVSCWLSDFKTKWSFVFWPTTVSDNNRNAKIADDFFKIRGVGIKLIGFE